MPAGWRRSLAACCTVLQHVTRRSYGRGGWRRSLAASLRCAREFASCHLYSVARAAAAEAKITPSASPDTLNAPNSPYGLSQLMILTSLLPTYPPIYPPTYPPTHLTHLTHLACYCSALLICRARVCAHLCYACVHEGVRTCLSCRMLAHTTLPSLPHVCCCC